MDATSYEDKTSPTRSPQTGYFRIIKGQSYWAEEDLAEVDILAIMEQIIQRDIVVINAMRFVTKERMV